MSAELLGEAERSLYLALLESGGRLPMAELSPSDARALAELLDLGLVVPRSEDAAYAAVDPRAVIGRIGAELRATGARLIAEADQVADLLGDLTRAYDGAPRRADRTGLIQHVHEFDSIRHRLAQLDSESTEELLIAQPGGARPLDMLKGGLRRVEAMVAQGVAIRCLYEPAAKTHRPTAAFAATVTELGCRYRVLDEPFKRMLIYDRRVAVVPASADHSSAAFIEDPTVVAFLVDSFDSDWQRAERVNWALWAETAADGLPVHEQVGRLLAQGLTQRAVASRLGLSERTVAGHISRLRELYDAETLFQLGWQLREVSCPAARSAREE